MMFPDWSGTEPALNPGLNTGLDDYWNALLLDLALADPEQQDAAMLRAGQVARLLGIVDAFETNLRRDAGMNKRELDRFKRQMDKETLA
jgi:hypothetical protein